MSVLVTGATGFIGSRLVAKLRAEGREVACLVRRTSAVQEIERLGARPVLADLVSGHDLERALEGVEDVIHLAGVIRAWSAETYFSVNVDGTRRLVESACGAGVRRFVLVSSLAAAGPSPRGMQLTELALPHPVGAYGESKLAAERVLAAAALDRMCWSVVRPCAVYGPGDRDIFQLLRLARLPIVPYCAPRGAHLSLVYVDDLVELLLLCLERSPSGGVYFSSDGEAYSWGQVIRAMAEALGRRGLPLRLPPALLFPFAAAVEALRLFRSRPPLFCLGKLREAAQVGWVCSPARARRELTFEPKMGLREGMAAAVRWYRDAGWL